jgi:hypothetical protein
MIVLCVSDALHPLYWRWHSHQKLKENFNYELSILPPSLFDPETQLLRKSDKSSLARTLDDIATSLNYMLPAVTSYVLDGGALLHKLPWPKNGKFSDVLQLYSSHIAKQYKVVTIVFDGYAISSTKDVEHQIRTKQSSVTVKFTESSPFLIGKGPFLSNNENKQCFITMLGKHLEANGHTVIHATDSLYGGNTKTETLNLLRYNLYLKKITTAKSEFNIARLPPTEDAAVHHLLRVHLQCLCWKTMNTNIANPEEWGWKK